MPQPPPFQCSRPSCYPVNYGFVPQTVSYDGNPFDVLVLGPPVTGGRLVRGVIVGLMRMEDEKGLDSKVVISLVDRTGRATHRLTPGDERRIGDYFNRYKRHEPGKFSKVPGWDGPEQGLAFVKVTHAFFRECHQAAGHHAACAPDRRCSVGRGGRGTWMTPCVKLFSDHQLCGDPCLFDR